MLDCFNIFAYEGSIVDVVRGIKCGWVFFECFLIDFFSSYFYRSGL